MSTAQHTVEIPQSLTNGPSWLMQKRRGSLGAYATGAAPVRTAHLWRYTDPALFMPEANSSSAELDTTESEDFTRLHNELKAGALAAVALWRAHGVLRVESSPALRGALVAPLTSDNPQIAEIVSARLGALISAEFGKFEALNGALWDNGVLVYIPRGVKLTEPIVLIHDMSATDAWRYERLLVVADDDSAVTVVQEFVSPTGDKARSNVVVEVFGGANSSVEYVAINRINEMSTLYLTQRTQLGDNARSTLVMASLGGANTKVNLGANLVGRHAESRQYGIVFGSGKQRFDHHTVHLHSGANGYSNLDFKVALTGKAESAYTGLIRVEKDTPFCEAYQSNRNLLLSSGARAESIPELEIMCDEVICTHGATVGPIDPMEIFYLQSRGVEARTATQMIVRGHIEPTLHVLPESIKSRVAGYVDERIAAL